MTVQELRKRLQKCEANGCGDMSVVVFDKMRSGRDIYRDADHLLARNMKRGGDDVFGLVESRSDDAKPFIIVE